MCALFTGERACYLNRVNHERKIKSRKQKTDLGKYSFVKGTIQLCNQLLGCFGTLAYKPSNFWKKVRKVIDQVKWRCGANQKMYSEVK
jgi:hypothetical protein